MTQRAKQVKVDATPTNYTAGAAQVESHLAGLDGAVLDSGGASSTTNLGAGFALAVTKRVHPVDANGSARTSAATPLTGGSDGQGVVVINVGAENLIFQAAASFVTPDGLDLTLAQDKLFEAYRAGGVWYVVANT